jgi:phosphate transport system substrate-binding protein
MRTRPLTALLLAAALAAGCDAAPRRAPDAISCATGTAAAQGSSAQTTAVNAWIKDYQVSCAGAAVSYDSVGSGAGVRTFLDGTGDFAGTDAPLSEKDRPAAEARCHGAALHLPLVAGPIALAYNVAGVDALRLSPATIAKIFAGTITAWNDAAVARDNPGAALPATAIRPVHRSDSSGTTDNFTRFLAGTAGWTYPGGTSWTAPGGTGVKGSTRVVSAIEQNNGAIGYVEGSYARFRDLPTARVGNAAGDFTVLTDAAAARTLAAAKIVGRGDDLQLSIDYRTTTADAYPLVLVTYEIVCATGTSPLTKSFLAYAAGPAGQQVAVGCGYVPLPESLRVRAAQAIAKL